MTNNDTVTWEKELKTCICTIKQLKEYIALTPEEEKRLQKVIERHPMSITRYYMSLIDKNDPKDPIRKMIVPSEKEMNISGSYDTSGEEENTKMPGEALSRASSGFHKARKQDPRGFSGQAHRR